MEDYRKGTQGKLTIGISPFRALYLLTDMCGALRERFPGVTVVLNEDSSDKLRSKAIEGKYDFAIVNLPVNEALLDVTLIEQDTLVLAVPKQLLNKIGKTEKDSMEKIDFKDCKDLPFVVVSQNREMRLLFDKICAVSDMQPKISMEVVGLATAWSMARSGMGATLLPLQFVKNMNFENDVVLFVPEYNENIRQPAVVTRRGQYISEYAKFAIDKLTGKNI